MPLKYVVDSLDGMEDSVKSFYGQADDGKFYLQVETESGAPLEEVTGLKNTLKLELNKRKALEKQIKDLNPDGLQTRIKELETQLQAAGSNGAKAEEAIRSAVKSAEEQFKAQLQKLQGETKFLEDQLQQAMIVSVASQAIQGEKGEVGLLMPHVRQRARMKREGDKIQVEVVDEEGNPMYDVGKDGTTSPKTIASLVRDMKSSKVFQRAFEPTGANGVGSSGGSVNAPAGGKIKISRHDVQALSRHAKEIAEGKVEVVDE